LSEPAGRLLAALHTGAQPRVRRTTSLDLYGKACSRGRFVSDLLPALRPEVMDLLEVLKRTAPESPAVTSHGNFHAGQLLACPTGLAMVDVDRMCRASPAYDLACFAVHVAFGRPGDREVLGATVDSLLTGYGSRPDDLDWYLAACLLRRAAVPFRFQDEHWPAATAELVELARTVLR
jgi:aminoglycoside phosphotransferase (APT) family kinase protein